MSGSLVEALDALEREFLDAMPPAGHPIVRGIFQRLPDRLRAALAEVPVIPDEPDPVECAICGDYSAQGVEVHEVCLDMLSRTAARLSEPPQ